MALEWAFSFFVVHRRDDNTLIKPSRFKRSSPLTLIGVTAITPNGQIVLSLLFKLSGLFNLTCGWIPLRLSPSQETEWHTHTPMGKYDYLSGRSPLAADLLIEWTFFLPFNLRWYQSCWRIKWSLLELATIIKWQYDPRPREGGREGGAGVLVCQSDGGVRARRECVCAASERARGRRRRCLFIRFSPRFSRAGINHQVHSVKERTN